MELIQSFIYSVARSKMTLYEQRILIKVVEHAQVVLKGKLIKNSLFRMEHDLENIRIDLPVKYVLSDGSKHYEDVKEAARSLMSRKMEYWDSKLNGWYATPLIYNVAYVKGSGLISFYVSKMLFDVILDFTKGFCKYDLETALSLPSPCAVRLYSLMSSQSHPITLTIAELKKMMGVEEKYAQTRDFIKKIIDPAQKAMDKAHCNSFSYTRVYSGNKVTALTFSPKRVQVPTAAQLAAKLPTSALVEKEVTIMLISYMGFSTKEISAHKELLFAFCKIPYYQNLIYSIEKRFRSGNKGKGYVIAAMRDEVKNWAALQEKGKESRRRPSSAR